MAVAFHGLDEGRQKTLEPLAADPIGSFPKQHQRLAYGVVVDPPTRARIRPAAWLGSFQETLRVLAVNPGDGDELAIGARALTGSAYRGHVFWDTDVYVVPALAAMAPGLARSALG